jgi:DNA mismatch endonuclease (patch repair protein)
MADSLTREIRIWNMSRIRSTDTKPEIIVRSLLHQSGFHLNGTGVVIDRMHDT